MGHAKLILTVPEGAEMTTPARVRGRALTVSMGRRRACSRRSRGGRRRRQRRRAGEAGMGNIKIICQDHLPRLLSLFQRGAETRTPAGMSEKGLSGHE